MIINYKQICIYLFLSPPFLFEKVSLKLNDYSNLTVGISWIAYSKIHFVAILSNLKIDFVAALSNLEIRLTSFSIIRNGILFKRFTLKNGVLKSH